MAFNIHTYEISLHSSATIWFGGMNVSLCLGTHVTQLNETKQDEKKNHSNAHSRMHTHTVGTHEKILNGVRSNLNYHLMSWTKNNRRKWKQEEEIIIIKMNVSMERARTENMAQPALQYMV